MKESSGVNKMDTGQWIEPEIGIDAKPITEILNKRITITSVEFGYHDVHRQYVVITTNLGRYYTADKRLVNDFAIDAEKVKKKGYVKGYIDPKGRPRFVCEWWL